MSDQDTDHPFRVGVYDTVPQAMRAVRELLAAGFTRDELAVICSDKHKEHFFEGVPTPEPAGAFTTEGIVTGGAVGAALGGLVLIGSSIFLGGAPLLVGAPMLVGGGALAGSFTGAMMTRGLEKEIADYYDQAVQFGKILVAVELYGEGAPQRLAQAADILARAGAVPVPLVEG